MLSHDCYTWTAHTANRYLNMTPEDSMVSYLPLSHSAALMIDVFMPMSCGAAVYFGDQNALKGSLVDTLKEVKPTFLFGVPRLFEKIMEKMVEMGKSASVVQRLVADWAKSTGLDHNMKAVEGHIQDESYSYLLAKKLVFSKVRENLGLSHCRLLGVGAAPLAMETIKYFLSLDIPLLECFGMSETSGPQTGNLPGHHKLGSIGRTLDNMETRIANPDPRGNGELIFYGRNIMMGYLFNKEKTIEVIDQDGWLHSGDIGSKDSDGFLIITGRIKEILITAGGENVPPLPIEDSIKKELPCISNAMLIGDRKKFLSCFLTLKVEINGETMEPTNILSSQAIKWCKEVGSKATTVEEAMVDPEVKRAIQEGVTKVNSGAVSNAQRVQKWCIIPKDFSLPGGELGPTLKLKRHSVLDKYQKQLNHFYM